MSFIKKLNSRAKQESNTGFGSNAAVYGGRLINKDGKPNVKKVGISFLDRISWFHAMLNIARWQFFLIIFGFYFFVNIIFALLYCAIGTEHLIGLLAKNRVDNFGEAFFFSIQTFTTVGYGHISPSGFLTSFVASIEAMIGLLSFAIATGLFYGRFSKPKAFIQFSKNALIAPYKDAGGKALMLRLTPYKNTNFFDATAKVTLGINDEENGKPINKFYNLPLEIDALSSLMLSWTLVHHITEDSPLFNFSEDDYKNIKGEIVVFLTVFDDMYCTNVTCRTSYLLSEIVSGAKFSPMFSKDDNDSKTILDISKLNEFQKVTL